MYKDRVQPAIVIPVSCLLAGCASVVQPPLPAPGVSVERTVSLGGIQQTIFIRGRDRANPVLLFVHGGPGLPEMPFSHVNQKLERDFTVVHWDQAGAGKSYRPTISREVMNTDFFVACTLELARDLRREFGRQKIYLAGFSWGTLVSALAVKRSPGLFHAYVSISQLVDVPRSEQLLYRAGLAQAGAQRRFRIRDRLAAAGPPPHENRHDQRLVNDLTKRLQPELPVEMTRLRYAWLGLKSPYYNLIDDWQIVRGVKFSGKRLEADILSHNLFDEVPELDVPVYFCLGRHDTVLSAPLGARYFQHLRAPKGKELIWFEQSDHILHLEQSRQFRELLRRVLRESRTAGH